MRDDRRATCSYIPKTGIVPENNENITYKLSNNYPNPLNPTTKINYSIPTQSNVKLKAYNILGSVVATLVSKEQPVGNYEVEFDAAEIKKGEKFQPSSSHLSIEHKLCN